MVTISETFGTERGGWVQVLPEDDLEAAGPITDMDMSIMTAATGQERTRADWDRLLTSSGLDLLRVDTPAPGQPSFIYACVQASQ